MPDISPLAPKDIAILPTLKGVRIATQEAAIKYRGRRDLLFLVFDEVAEVAGVFTRSRCPSAPVDHCRLALKKGKARGLVVNSGNANAFTGKAGQTTTREVAKEAACLLGGSTDDVYLASTGVIGEPLDAKKITPHLARMLEQAREDAWEDAARAIMTTDTFPKLATRKVDFGGVCVTLNGIAKGAGMIAPDMATLLSFVVTDAPVCAGLLQEMLVSSVEKTFNCISVDSDTSTSDTLLAFATGTAVEHGASVPNDKKDLRFSALSAALDDLLLDLSLQIVRDGEGVRKLIEVRVKGATSSAAAKKIAFCVVNSPLVKTAIAGEDANWGRVVMAVGKAGEEADRDRLSIWFGDIEVAKQGARAPDYSENLTAAYMKNSHIVITVDVGLAEGQACVWGCDLTHEYVAINGDYRS